MNTTDKIFYAIGVTIWGGLITVLLLRTFRVPELTNIPIPCSFFAVTGLYCPGCGGTHAVYSLLSGHFLDSIRFHAFVPYTALYFLAFLVWNTTAALYNRQGHKSHSARKKRRKPLPFFHFQLIYLYIGIGILLSQWIIKNIILLLA